MVVCSFLYVLAPGALTVDVLDVSTAGNAMTVQNFNFTSAAEQAGVTLSELTCFLFNLAILLALFSILRHHFKLLGWNDDFRLLSVVHILS